MLSTTLGLLLALVGSASALPSNVGLSAPVSLANNLAYRSPSLTVRSLEIDAHTVYNRKRWTDTYQGNLSFPYGVASGDPESDSVILWTMPRKTVANGYPPICLRWVVTTQNSSFAVKDSVANGYVQTTPDVGFSVKVEVKGLKSYTQYYYRFESCEEQAKPGLGYSPVGLFKTLPSEEADVEKLRLATFSCSNLPNGYFNAYGNAANNSDRLDYWQHVGDYIYEGANKKTNLPGRDFKPDREIATLQDYRDRYSSYRVDPDLAELHRKLAVFAIWDDHEVADNTYKSGSADSNDTLTGEIGTVKFSDRRANAVRAYYEWMPIRQVDTDDKLRIWRSFKLGKLATLILMDTRQYDRDITDIYYNTAKIKAMAYDQDRSITGEKQQGWIFDQLKAHKDRGATWPVLSQQVIFSSFSKAVATGGDPELNYDAWDGYQAERDRILHYIQSNEINNTIVLSGDSHASWVFDVKRYNNDTQYDPETGAGALGVEFAGTAVSSSSSYGSLKTDNLYLETAKNYTLGSPALQYAEGQLRGYFEYTLTPQSARADFYGFYDQTTRNSNVTNVASFETEVNTNRLKRPLNGGVKPAFGSLGAKFQT